MNDAADSSKKSSPRPRRRPHRNRHARGHNAQPQANPGDNNTHPPLPAPPADRDNPKAKRERFRKPQRDHQRAPRLSVVVPLFNEAPSLNELYEKIVAALQALGISAEMIFVDDGSTDNSFDTLTHLRRRDQRVRVLQFRRNYGKSAALAAAFARARGDYLVTMDADLQDDPAEMKAMLDKLEAGYDLVSGWKRQRYDSFIKRFSSKIFNRVTSIVTGLRIHDINCGLKAYRRDVTQTIPVYGELHRFLAVLAHREGFRVGEIEVKHHPRKHGKSKFGPSRFTKGFLDLLTVLFLTRYTKRPLHLFGLAGIISFVLGLGVSAYLAVERLLWSVYLTNRPLLFLGILLMIIGVQMFSIGLIGEMITATNTQAPAYFVKAELGFGRKQE